MKILLIAVYLHAGTTSPELRVRTENSLESCRAVAKIYVKQAKIGQAWAWCVKVKPGVKS